jgi:hypothetical protein
VAAALLRTIHPNVNTMKPVDTLSDDEFVHLVQRAVALPDAPSALVRAAIGLWAQREATSLADAARAGLRLVSAVLSFDSWARPPVALGMRGVAINTRHLLFTAHGRDIDLRISPAADLYALRGQILGPDEAGEVELSAASGSAPGALEARTAPFDSMGEFRLDDVHGGTYRLTLRMGGDEIVLPPIDVGERTR